MITSTKYALALALCVALFATPTRAELGVQVTGAGDAQVNGWYTRKSTGGMPKAWSEDEGDRYNMRKWINQNGGEYWYEKDDGCFINHNGKVWYITGADNKLRYQRRHSGFCPNAPTKEWDCSQLGDGPAPTVSRLMIGPRSLARRLVGSESGVQVTGAGDAQVNGYYERRDATDPNKEGRSWYEKANGCSIRCKRVTAIADGYSCQWTIRSPPSQAHTAGVRLYFGGKTNSATGVISFREVNLDVPPIVGWHTLGGTQAPPPMLRVVN